MWFHSFNYGTMFHVDWCHADAAFEVQMMAGYSACVLFNSFTLSTDSTCTLSDQKNRITCNKTGLQDLKIFSFSLWLEQKYKKHHGIESTPVWQCRQQKWYNFTKVVYTWLLYCSLKLRVFSLSGHLCIHMFKHLLKKIYSTFCSAFVKSVVLKAGSGDPPASLRSFQGVPSKKGNNLLSL